MGREGLLHRAAEIYDEKGLARLLTEGYNHFAPKPVRFRYGFVNTVTNPELLAGHVKRNVLRPINTTYHSLAYPMTEGTNVLKADWENLVILDACRVDAFERRNDIEGEFDTITAIASRSPTFMSRTFENETYHDTVYVSGNTHTVSYQDGIFHDVVNVWDGGWEDEHGAVPPETVTDKALEAYERYPDKRLLVHYMQPHSPHLGESATRLRESKDWARLKELSGKDKPNIYPALWYNAISISEEYLREMYVETFDIVLEELGKLLDVVEGKTVVTSDHGELLGEGVGPIPLTSYGHPPLYTDELRRVPWFTVAGTDRRETVAEPTRADAEEAKRQLSALGYVE